jgi:hypothetical protein
MNFRDLTGQKFNRLTAVKRVENSPTQHQARWLFKCDCGSEVVAFGYNVTTERQKSCGCLLRDHPPRLRHGMSNSRAFHSWSSLRQRCLNENCKSYKGYGARGITVCERWNTFENFLADMGEPPAGHSIERKDNNGPYDPGNCVWATATTQVRNRRTSTMVTREGKTLNLAEWAEIFGIPYQTLWHRYKIGRRGDQLFSPLRVIARRKAKA